MQTGGGGFFQNGISTVVRTQGGSGTSTLPMRIGAYAEGNSHADSNHQEFIVYQTAQLSNRGPIEYNINDYYNIYPQTSSFATSSFTIKADSGSISGSLNNRLTSGIAASGPLGLITVSRTGSNSLTIARNGVTSSFSVPASGALSTNLYLGAINNNGIAVGNSPVNISFASVGTGLTGVESTTYFNLVNSLNYRLGRGVNAEYDAVLEYGILQGYTLPSVDQQALQNQLVSDLKNAGIWDKLDTFAVFATDGDSDFALIDWKRLTEYTAVNSPTFTTNQGYAGNGLNAYIDTSFNPSLASKMSANSANMTVFMNTITDSANLVCFAGCIDPYALQIVEYKQFNRMLHDVFGNNASVPFVSSNGSKWFSANRNNSTEQVFFQNTLSTTQARNFSGLPNRNIFLLARNGSSVSLPSNREISMFAGGENLISENTDFYNAWNTYFNAI
jgi:hypothetical protein